MRLPTLCESLALRDYLIHDLLEEDSVVQESLSW